METISKYSTVTSDKAPLVGPRNFMPINKRAVGGDKLQFSNTGDFCSQTFDGRL